MAVVIGRGSERDEFAAPLQAPAGIEPASYRIVYATTVGTEKTTEIVAVRRPFVSRIEVRRGAPPGGEVRSVRVSRFGVIEAKSPSSPPTGITVAPTIASGDLRLLPALERALAGGVIVARGDATVAGRLCRRFMTGGPVASGTLVPFTDDAAEHAEICVDNNGLLLRERWSKDGKLLRDRRAVAVTALDAEADFSIAGAAHPADGADGSLTAVTAESRLPLGHWDLVDGPPRPSFSLLGAWTSISPRLTATSALDADEGRLAMLHHVWTDGIDVVLVEQGATLGDSPGPAPHPYATGVDLGQLGAGEAVGDFRLNEVRAIVPGFGLVRVAGTIPLEEITAIARRLVRLPGGELTPTTSPSAKEHE